MRFYSARSMQPAKAMKNPSWWNEKHEGAWDRTKSAMKRDWEQTKSDFSSKKGHDLDQSAGDTVKQAAGKEAIPPGNQPNPPKADSKWEDVEPAYRYGVGAHEQYANQDWNPELESRLEKEWKSTDVNRPWEDAKGYVRKAWPSKK
ncbi:MAG TPA: hypothetical protein VGM39_25550 [Kofleriaceae bacterium]